MGFFSSIGKALGGVVKTVSNVISNPVGALLGSVGGRILDNSLASGRAEDAQGFSAQQYATRYQTTTKDMLAAGLNPMLAYTNGVGATPTGIVAGSASGGADLGALLNQSKMNSAQVANIEADTKNKEAQADLIDAQAAQAWSSAGLNQENVRQVRANVDKILQETQNLVSERARIEQATKTLLSQAQLNYEKGLTEPQVRAQMEATIARLESETKLNNFSIDAMKQLDNLGNELRQFGPIIDLFKAIITSRSMR